jgi:hypothetical protein
MILAAFRITAIRHSIDDPDTVNELEVLMPENWWFQISQWSRAKADDPQK